MHLDRELFAIDLPKTETGQKNLYSSTSSSGLPPCGDCLPARRRGVVARLGTRAQEGRFERRLARSRAHEAEQRDGEVNFSVRPRLPELGLGLRSAIPRPPSISVENRD